MSHQEQDSPLKTLADGFNLFFLLCMCVNRTVQLWSRVPGTLGAWGFLPFLLGGNVLLTWYVQANMAVSQKLDWIPQTLHLGLQLNWLAVHGVRHRILMRRGMAFHSYGHGTGVLDGFLPSFEPATVALVSDVGVALTLAFLLRVFASPILSGWYAASCLWLLVAHLWFKARDARIAQSRTDAQLEAKHWSQLTHRNQS